MADTTVVVAAAPIPGDALARAEKFAREPFVHEGEDAASVLAEGTPRRRALDAALVEIAEGRDRPSVGWRREFSLMLGLERLLAREEPRLADGTVLSAHQVDALSGTLIALLAEAQGTSRNGGRPGSADGANGAGASVPAVAELPSEEEEIEGDEELGDDEEPLDWTPTPRRQAMETRWTWARTRARPGGSGSSTPPAPARPWPRWASSRPRARAAC